jgi:hypothetical protein
MQIDNLKDKNIELDIKVKNDTIEYRNVVKDLEDRL